MFLPLFLLEITFLIQFTVSANLQTDMISQGKPPKRLFPAPVLLQNATSSSW